MNEKSATQTSEQPKKWTSQAGPVQTNKVRKAIQDLQSEGHSYTEKSGVIGGEEHSFSHYSPFGAMREDVATALTALGEKFAWTITRENYQQVIAAAVDALNAARETRPVVDKRQTAEQRAQQQAEYQAAHEAQQAKEREHRDQVGAKVIELQPQYPWAEPARDGVSTHARAAKNMRTELDRAFPGILFTVHSEYGRISVRWHQGPTESEVKALLGKYQKDHWDGQADMTRTDHSVYGEAIEVILGRVGYVSLDRGYSGEIQAQVADLLRELQQKPGLNLYARGLLGDGDEFELRDHVYQVLHRTSFPACAKIVGVYRTREEFDKFSEAALAKYGPGWAQQANRCNLDPEDKARLEAFEAKWEKQPEAEHWCALRLEVPKLDQVPASATPTTSSESGITVRRNLEHDGVEIRFPSKPSPEVISRLKSARWRWSMRSHCWYTRFSSFAWKFAHEIAGIPAPALSPETVCPGCNELNTACRCAKEEPDRFDMAVEDQMAEAAGVASGDGRW